MQVKCPEDDRIALYLDSDDVVPADWPADPVGFIGLSLHAIQQFQAYGLIVHGLWVRALRMDQTGGEVDLDDIFLTDHPQQRFQRLRDILADNPTM
jgi:hypothetical protein